MEVTTAIPEPGFWRGKRVLVTEHTGFKGAWLVLWLRRMGARTTGISLPPNTAPSLFELARVGDACESRICENRDAAALAERSGFFVSRLRELGIEPVQARQLAADIVERLQRMVRDPRAQWLFDPPHSEARSEWRLSGVVDGELRNAVIDRSFVADGIRWVVDFKTSTHAGAGLEEFLQSEMDRYRPQLRLYRTLASRAGAEPVRAALYFPWLGEFREVE